MEKRGADTSTSSVSARLSVLFGFGSNSVLFQFCSGVLRSVRFSSVHLVGNVLLGWACL